MRTSNTDTPEYRAACAAADVTKDFRSDPVLEAAWGVPAWAGLAYALRLGQLAPDLLGEERDANRLRYLNVYFDLRVAFGSLHTLNIVEIGGGYGGQAEVILEREGQPSYTLVDLPEPLDLQRRYLEHSCVCDDGLFGCAHYIRSDELVSLIPGLVISNYAFSEMTADVQRFYIERVLSLASRGYMVCNFISAGIESLSAEQLTEAIPGSHWIEEDPKTHPLNRVLVWGDE